MVLLEAIIAKIREILKKRKLKKTSTIIIVENNKDTIVNVYLNNR